MEYTITTKAKGALLTSAAVTVVDNSAIVFIGEIDVCTENPAVAYQYAEDVYLCDMRRNFPGVLGALMLPADTVVGSGG